MGKVEDCIKFLLDDYLERMNYKRIDYVQSLETENNAKVKSVFRKAIKRFDANIKQAEALKKSLESKKA